MLLQKLKINQKNKEQNTLESAIGEWKATF